MRRPASPQRELNGPGNMVNGSIKTEEKNESCYKSTQGEATSATPGCDEQHESASLHSEGIDSQNLPQVKKRLLGYLLPPLAEEGLSSLSVLIGPDLRLQRSNTEVSMLYLHAVMSPSLN